MPTTQSFSFYHTNSIAMLYLVHKYKKMFESSNMDLTHSLILIFASFSGKGVWLINNVKQTVNNQKSETDYSKLAWPHFDITHYAKEKKVHYSLDLSILTFIFL